MIRKSGRQFPSPAAREASESRPFHGFVRGIYPPPEKCDAKECANPPKPPRCTLPELESEVPEDEWLEEESPEKKLLREEVPPPEPPWLLPDEDPRGWHAALPTGVAIPGCVGSQFWRGISA